MMHTVLEANPVWADGCGCVGRLRLVVHEYIGHVNV